jgi:hypothetical protein
MPPVHTIPHILKIGGIPAGIGVVIALVLCWPQSDPSTGLLGATTYHNSLGGSGMTAEGAVGVMIGACIAFGIGGFLIGALLVALGVTNKKDLGMEE